jgi:hypothetical protein
VLFLVEAGIRLFLDVGSGIPTVGHVHDIAQAAAPESRVVFVDIDPIAVAHSRDILRRNDRTAVIEEDVRHPQISGRAGIQGVPRSHHQVERLFGEFNLVEPGLVWVPQWHPESPDDLYLDRPEASGVYAGVGRKP